MTRFFPVLIGALLWVAATAQSHAQITVFAAASLREVLEDIAADHSDPVRLSFSGSGTIARQVAAGAPVDVVVLASSAWMAWLRNQGLVGMDAAKQVAANNLVLIGPQDAKPLSAIADLPGRLGYGRLAMGQRDAVPAGVYARQWLTSEGLWPALADQLAETDNVRSALVLVARAQAPFGVVYATDAAAEPDVRVLWTADSAGHDPIVYWAAAVTPAGDALVDLMLSAQGQSLFAARGFAAVPQ